MHLIVPYIGLSSTSIFFFFKVRQKNLPLQTVSLKNLPCSEFLWPLPTPGRFFRAGVIYSSVVIVNIK